MQQMDLFDVTLEKKIHRLEKWISRLNKEVWFLKNVYQMNQTRVRVKIDDKKSDQMEMAL